MPLKVAIVGCGKIADSHAEQIRYIDACELVAVCDREELMARQLAERFGNPRCFDDLGQLFDEAKPDVVHITTPPQSHFAIAQQCLQRGCHVYVEKPFTTDAQEAEELVELAERRGLSLTVGHDAQFSPTARRVRSLIRQGYLGDRVVHLESYYGYDLGDPAYARAFLADAGHWVHKLPGGLLQNVISHGLARIAELLRGDQPRVVAHGFVSPALRNAGSDSTLDELRVIIVDEHHTSAYFTFSSQMRPLVQQFRIFGSTNGLIMDEVQQTVVKLRGRAFKSYLERFVPPLLFAGQHVENVGRNVRLFLRSQFHMEAGKRELMKQFYRSIAERTPAPIPTVEILRTARMMDEVFAQLRAAMPSTKQKEAV